MDIDAPKWKLLRGSAESPRRGSIPNLYAPTLDHVWPLSKGGHSGYGNLLASHFVCNGEKSSHLPTDAELDMLEVVNFLLSEMLPPANGTRFYLNYAGPPPTLQAMLNARAKKKAADA